VIAAEEPGSGPAPGEHPGAVAGDERRVFRVAVLASGSGSNLQAMIDQLHCPPFRIVDGRDGVTPRRYETRQAGVPRIELVLVISDVPGARALERAERAGIRTAVVPIHDFRNREEHDLALLTRLLEAEPDLVVLAGYMRLVSPALLKAFPWRVINLHPALLPAFPGTTAISDAIRYGVKVTGVTVHFVDEGVDTGPVIAQEAVRVEEGDTVESLAARIHEVEHRLLPSTVRLIAAGKVHPPLPGSRVVRVDWGAE
jgi:phosphoribosylglycinamide formyltransferase-1